jgi:two-component system chemotaxis response regulator CheY
MARKILIVDDSPISRKMLKSCMPKDEEHEYHEAGDGLAGLEKFREIEPDITFLDLTMPVMDGVQALEEMKKHTSDAVIIVATADIQVKSIEKVMGLGAFLVLKKPPTKESVKDALAKVDELRGKRHGS